jgi:hypothetical protein
MADRVYLKLKSANLLLRPAVVEDKWAVHSNGPVVGDLSEALSAAGDDCARALFSRTLKCRVRQIQRRKQAEL